MHLEFFFESKRIRLDKELEDILFSRQFIFCNKKLKVAANWNVKNLGEEYFLHTHENLEITEVNFGSRKIFLLGYLFDPFQPERTNIQIVEGLIEKPSFEEVLHSTFDLAGRFVIFYEGDNGFHVFHDAAGLREVFYINDNGSLWCASQPSLLSNYFDLKRETENAQQQFYASETFKVRKERIADTTQYKGLMHLMPNYQLDIKKGKCERYYPYEKNVHMNLSDAVEKCSFYLRGIIKAASHRYKLMIAVTAGYDSRMMFAASEGIYEQVYYFILKSRSLQTDNPDIKIPKSLFNKLGIDFNVLEYPERVDNKIQHAMEDGVELINRGHFAFLYNAFYKRFRGNMNITSVSEFARNYFHYQVNPDKVTGKVLTKLNKFPEIEFIESTYQKWIDENKSVFEKHGYNILDMFYWEEKMGNWLANGRSSMSNVIEDFSPFNCKNLMTLFLSVDEKYRDRYNPILHKKIIEHLSKDALKVVVNGSFKYTLIKWLVILKLYPLLKRIQFALRLN